MKKKNKIENSLERLFSTKKNDLTNESAAPASIPQPEAKAEPKLPDAPVAPLPEKKPKPVTEKKPKPEPVKAAEPKKAATEPVKPVIPVLKEEKPKQPAPEPVQPPPVKPQPEPIQPSTALAPEKTKTIVDESMTQAIVAKKSETGYANDEHLVIFSLAGQSYGISIMIVESIIKMQDITWVPRAHPCIEGATNLRGVVLPVINVCKKLGLQVSKDMENNRIIVVAVQDVTAGLVVDSVKSVYQIAASEISPPSPMVSSINTKYIKGIAKNGEHGLVIILDPVKIFESIVDETKDKNQITLLR